MSKPRACLATSAAALLCCCLLSCTEHKAPSAQEAAPPKAAPPAPPAPAPQPTPESVERMLELTGVQKLNAAVIRQLEGMSDNIVSHTFDEKKMTPRTKELAESARQRLRQIVEDDLAWDRMKSVYARIYTENFTQEDVDGVNAFYASKAEQDYAAKTPTVTKRTYGQIQQRIGPIMQKMQDSMKAAKAQAQAMGYPAAPVAPAPASPPKSR